MLPRHSRFADGAVVNPVETSRVGGCASRTFSAVNGTHSRVGHMLFVPDITSAGFGDVLLFNTSNQIRDWFDIGSVDECSCAYNYGEWAGVAGSIGTGFMGGTKFIANATRAATGEIAWSHFSHSLFPKSFLKKCKNRFAKWLNEVGNRLNGDYITPELHWKIDPTFRTRFLKPEQRAMNHLLVMLEQ